MPKAAKSIVIGVALGAITGGAGFLVGAAVGTVAFTAAAAATTIATSAVLGGLSAGLNTALAAKPLKPSSSTSIRQPAFVLGVPYGETRVSGGWSVYEQGEVDSRDLIIAVTHSCCSIEGHLEIWAGDKLLWTASGGDEDADKAEVEPFDGADDQTTPALLATHLPSVFTAGAAWQRGCAGYVIRFRRVGRNWPNLAAPWARVEGCNTVFDPRTGLRRYSRSWALCVADYLTRQRGGAGYDYDQDIDDTALRAAANLCGESVSEDGGARPRYVLDGFVESDRTHGDVLDAMKVYAAGEIIDRNGLFVIQPGAYAAPTETLETADLAGPVTIDSAIAVEQRIHGAEGVYSRADANFVSDSYPPVIFDGSPEPPDLLRIDLPMCVTPDRAQRLAGLSARQAQRSLRVAADWGPAAFGLRAGDTRTLSLPMFGIAAAVEARSTALDLSPAGASMRAVLLETGASFYAGVTTTAAPVSTQSTLQNPNTVQPPSNVEAIAFTLIESDGAVARWVRVTWDASPYPYEPTYVVRWTQDGKEYAQETAATRLEFRAPASTAVTVTVATRAPLGAESAEVAPAGAVTPGGDVTPPGVPPSGTIHPIAGGFRFRIGNPTDADFAGLRLYEGASGAAFGSCVAYNDYPATPGGQPTEFTRGGLGADVTKRYFITAFDRSGNESLPYGPLEDTTPTQLTQAEIDAAISDAVSIANAAEAEAAQAISDAAAAAASALTADGKAVTAQNLAAEAQADADQAIADAAAADSRIDTEVSAVRASFERGAAQLMPSDFLSGGASWAGTDIGLWPGALSESFIVDDPDYGRAAERTGFAFVVPRGVLPATPGVVYQFEALVRVTVDSTVVGGTREAFRLQATRLNGDGTLHSYTSGETHPDGSPLGIDVLRVADGWTLMKVRIPVVADPAYKWLRPRLYAQFNSGSNGNATWRVAWLRVLDVTDVTTLSVEVSTTTTALANEDIALGDRIDNVIVSIGGVDDRVDAEIFNRQTAIAEEGLARTAEINEAKSEITGGSARTIAQVDASQATKVTEAQAAAAADTRIGAALESGGAIKTATDAAITTVSNAFADADTALANTVTELSASIGGVNLIRKANFDDQDLGEWFGSGGASIAVSGFVPSGSVAGRRSLRVNKPSGGNIGYALEPFRKGSLGGRKLRVRAEVHTAAAANTCTVRLGIQIKTATLSYPVALSATVADGLSWATVDSEITPTDGMEWRPIVQVLGTGVGEIYLDGMVIEDVDAAEDIRAWAKQSSSALAGDGAAWAQTVEDQGTRLGDAESTITTQGTALITQGQSISSLTTTLNATNSTVSGLSATVATQGSAIDDIEAGLSAYYGIKVKAANALAFVDMLSDAELGSALVLGADAVTIQGGAITLDGDTTVDGDFQITGSLHIGSGTVVTGNFADRAAALQAWSADAGTGATAPVGVWTTIRALSFDRSDPAPVRLDYSVSITNTLATASKVSVRVTENSVLVSLSTITETLEPGQELVIQGFVLDTARAAVGVVTFDLDLYAFHGGQEAGRRVLIAEQLKKAV